MLSTGAENGTVHHLRCVVDGVSRFRHSLDELRSGNGDDNCGKGRQHIWRDAAIFTRASRRHVLND